MSKVTVELSSIGPVVITRSARAKHLTITVKHDQTIRLTIPRGISMKTANQFLESKIPWIQKNIRKFQAMEEHSSRPFFAPLDESKARHMLIKRLEEIAHIYGFQYTKVSIRKQKTRWGSCSAKNHISLNMNLVRLPDALRDYVILHELVHTRIKNHSPVFWKELSQLVGGNAKILAKEVKHYPLHQMV